MTQPAPVHPINPDVRRILEADNEALQLAIGRVELLRELARLRARAAGLDTYYEGERYRRQLQIEDAAARLAAFDREHGQGRMFP